MPSRSLISSAVSVSILSSLRGPLVHPRPDLSDLRVDLFERIAQRGQRLEQVVPVKAPEVGGASVPAVLKEGQPGPHSRGPQAPFLGVIGFSKCRIDVFREDMEPPVEISTGGSISSRNTSILHLLKPMTPRNGACGPLECGPG